MLFNDEGFGFCLVECKQEVVDQDIFLLIFYYLGSSFSFSFFLFYALLVIIIIIGAHSCNYNNHLVMRPHVLADQGARSATHADESWSFL
jgi:hypothetical protein